MSTADLGGRARFLRFLVTGGIAAAVNVLARIVLSLALPFEAAIVLAYGIGMLTAYWLAKLFVFAPSGRGVGSELTRFALVNLVALAQVWLVSVGLARFLFPAIGFTWHAETIAHAIGVASPVVTSFFGHKRFSFGRGN